MEDKSVDFVNVSLRIRPTLNQDRTSSCLQVISKQPPILLVLDRSQTYHLDKIFTEEVDQQTVYNETVKPLVECVKKGYNSTVFAYGQTGTGKTYTMGTSSHVESDEDLGLVPRTLDQFFESHLGDDNSEIDILISFIEIYNEKVFDLLQESNKSPLIVKGFKVHGFKQVNVFNCHEAKHLLKIGNKNRHTTGTKQNANSSRSHAIFTIYCNIKYRDRETCSKLNLVDLAGCESVRKTGNQGSTFQEGVNINKGLLCIGQVMTALSTNASYIPYRQSIITLMLQDSLNTKNFISLIACVNSNPEDCNETVQTLEFAQRVKKMRNKPEVSEAVSQYKKDNPSLFQSSKLGSTPFKRPAPAYQTPYTVKKNKLPLKVINESVGHNTAIERPESLSSLSISSALSTADITQQNLSPIIKKHINAMESNLMNKLESIIINTLKRPTRSSLSKEDKNKENTPKLSWNNIQNEVSKLVRQEIAQLTAKATRAASSPIEDHPHFTKIKRILKYDSPVLDERQENNEVQNTCTPSEISSIDVEFKIPDLPISKPKSRKAKRTSFISPINFVPRKSLRLSLKKRNSSFEDSDISLESSYIQAKKRTSKRHFVKDNGINSNDNNNSQSYRRYSVRLSQKITHLQERGSGTIVTHDINQSCLLEEINMDSNSQNHKRYSVRLMNKRSQDEPMSKKVKNNHINDNSFAEFNDTMNHMTRKRKEPVFDDKKQVSSEYMDCPSGNNEHITSGVQLKKKKNLKNNLCSLCADEPSVVYSEKKLGNSKDKRKKLNIKEKLGNRVIENHVQNDSPSTAHTKYVLNMLNDGNTKQIEQLHSVGPKTAQQILLFRDIKGKIEKISDLLEMPGWRGKKYEKFAAQNFLKQELC